jgi:hypothetical protein
MTKIEGYLKYWLDKMSFTEWTYNIDYEALQNEDNSSINAAIVPQWEYQHFNLKFYLPNLVNHGDKELENTVIHELSHALVNQMERPSTRRVDVETVVTNLSRILFKVKYENSSKALRKK